MKLIDIMKHLLSLLCVLGLWSCSTDDILNVGGDKETYDTDTYQSELRQEKSDSATFVLNPDVKIFSEAQLKNLLELRDDSILVFSSELPEQYLPQPGDIYVYSTGTGVDCEALKYGFMRRVESVERSTRAGGAFAIKTVDVVLKEVFEYIKASAQLRPAALSPKYEVPVFSYNRKLELGDCVTYEGLYEMRLRGNAEINMANNTFYVSMTPVYVLEGKASLEVGAAVDYDDTKKHIGHLAFARFIFPLGEIPVPMSFGINEYFYFTAEAKIVATTSVKAEIKPFTLEFGFKSGYPYRDWKQNSFDHILGDDFMYQRTLGLNLSAGIGFKTLFGLNVCEKPIIDINGASVDIWLGASSEVTFDLDKLSEAPKEIRDTPIEVTGKIKAGFSLKATPFEDVKFPIKLPEFAPEPWHFFDLYLWPDFASTNHVVKDNDVTLRTQMERNLLLPVKLGYTVTDEEGNEMGKYMDFDRSYWLKNLYDNPLSRVVPNLEEGKTYYAHPTVHYPILNKSFAPRDYKPYPFSLEQQDPPYYGVWEMTHIKGIEGGEAYEGDVTPDALIVRFTLREDSTFNYYAWAKGEDGDEDEVVDDNGTWSYENNEITLLYDNGYYKSIIKVLEWTPTTLVTKQTDDGDYEIRTFILKE